jgi:hypothetical protein
MVIEDVFKVGFKVGFKVVSLVGHTDFLVSLWMAILRLR